MRAAMVNVDLFTAIWEWVLQLSYVFLRYIYIDASPQFGVNYLCLRADRVRIPRALLYHHGIPPDFDFNANFESRICIASACGYRNAGVVKTGSNLANVYLTESESFAMFDEKRGEIKGGVSDQGTDKAMVMKVCELSRGMRTTSQLTVLCSFSYLQYCGCQACCIFFIMHCKNQWRLCLGVRDSLRCCELLNTLRVASPFGQHSCFIVCGLRNGICS